ncbi:HXXEE domain-containing protein [Azorhizobium doebereinerae]|uniref:HXXEE domain-containing protein n=1 Tax=Azorhizobium doebereinerae TaxID=281091 RepID=UPI0003F7607E|nr:HXXEE domain-containing protein [Azorhizobium doebereinerae]
MLARLMTNWVYGGFLAGFVLLALLPLVGASLPLLLVMLQLPVYMLHQYEEHDDDRFRRFVNENMGGGRNVLPVPAVFVINIGGVWLFNLVSIWLAATVDLGLGLIGIYGMLVNGVVHVAAAIAGRRYNPGLVTAIVLMLPAGLAGLWQVTASGHGGWGFQAIGLAAAIVLHIAIIGYVVTNKRRLSA